VELQDVPGLQFKTITKKVENNGLSRHHFNFDQASCLSQAHLPLGLAEGPHLWCITITKALTPSPHTLKVGLTELSPWVWGFDLCHAPQVCTLTQPQNVNKPDSARWGCLNQPPNTHTHTLHKDYIDSTPKVPHTPLPPPIYYIMHLIYAIGQGWLFMCYGDLRECRECSFFIGFDSIATQANSN